jgi:ABC-2 type transport system permease protein
LISAYGALAVAGFRRYAAYRQAVLASIVTNTAFGFLRCFVLLALAAAAGGTVAGYDGPRLATFVWVSQGLIGTVLLWWPAELAERIRTGEIVADLLRPVDLLAGQLATDLGRAAYGALTRLVVPIAVGALAFDLYAPRRAATYPLAALSVLLAVVVCAGCRFLVSACGYWLLDVRGPHMMWLLGSTTLTGMTFPLHLLPGGLRAALFYGTPFPSVVQIPLDIVVERGDAAGPLLALQAGWAVAVLALCRVVQRRGERRLVVQGG